jgi:hypothetical protein
MEAEEVSDFTTRFAKEHARPTPMQQSPLCTACCKIPLKWLLKDIARSFILFETIEPLIINEKHCKLCRLISRSIQAKVSLENVNGYIALALSPKFLIIDCEYGFNKSRVFLRLFANADSEAASEGFEVGLPYFDKTTYFKLLRAWLRECVHYHSHHRISPLAESGPPTKNLEEVTGQSMRESDEETELPTRVLAVGSLEAPDLRLYCSKKGERGKYIALSHCWGTDQEQQPLQTTKNELEIYQQGIDFNELPKTFKNAVTVAREIKVQYLWIDSLCIIQDKNSEDWETESQKMEQVFSSAYCTIAATSAKNSHEGFFTIPKKKAVTIPDGENSQFVVCACTADKSFKQAVDDDGLLNTRGWVLQERALSRRTIHFTESQIFWECGSVIRYDNLCQRAG